MASARRAVVFFAVAVAHVLLLYGLAASRRPVLAPTSDEPAIVSLWIPTAKSTSRTDEIPADAAGAHSRPTRARSASRNPRVAPISQSQPAPTAAPAWEPLTAAPESDHSTNSGVPATSGSIDWYGEAGFSASRALSGAAEKRRQASAFVAPPPPPSLARPPPAGYRFGWSEVATQRFRVVNGVPILRINERCAVAFFILAGCMIGKIEARGDLFQHMHDPPPAGQADLP